MFTGCAEKTVGRVNETGRVPAVEWLTFCCAARLIHSFAW